MLKTNSKQARENIRDYILKNYDPTNYEPNAPKKSAGFATVAAFILETFRSEKFYNDNYYKAHNIPESAAFADWCAGLPSVLDTCYFYNRSAVDDLGAILEETETEKNRFTESDAEKKLTYLIYNELLRGAKK